MVRIGIDFGYKFSGIALLDDNNEVSDYRILEHRIGLSNTLTKRRQLRAMRRRNNSKRRRLRDFYALLKGMGLMPANSRPGETMTLADRMRIGNRLYALAHYRGWDYAELSEQLVILSDDKAPQLPPVVKNIDNFLLLEYHAPAAPQKSKKKKGESEDSYKRAQQSADDAVARRNESADSEITKEQLRFIELKNPFLGELYRLEKELHDHGKKADKAKTDEQIGNLQEQIALLQDECDNVYRKISGGKDHIEEWLRERLKVVYDGKEPPQSEDIINRVMVELGLKTAEELFDRGKIYRPHRNRHRDEMISELQKLMRHACGEEDGADGVFLEHYQKTMKKCKPKDAPPRDVFWACWQDDIKRAQAQAKKIANQRSAAENRPITPQDVVKRWVKTAEGIVKHEYRKKRFENRKIGKCPARCDGEKCGNNLPRKSRTDIRRLQCEIEMRNMNIADHGKSRKMTEEEIEKVLSGLRLHKQKLSPEDKAHNRAVVKREIKTPPVKNDARGKKESLGDIVGGDQNGRAALCVVHLQEKLRILKEGIDSNIDAWNSMHEERILDLLDAPPSIRQKAERVVREVRKMLHQQPNAEVAHIGLETARFDISALAQAEGKKMKATQYQKSRSPIDKVGLAAEQDNLCFLCGKPLGRNIHVDHLRPRKRGGSNVRLNLVAMHDYCNINKGKYDSSVSERALAALLRNNSRKGEAVQKTLDKSHFLPKLEAPQHTMFGAKILKGALMNALNISREKAGDIICRPRAVDVAFFRRRWFNFMDRQKSAIRAKKWDIKIIAGASTEVDLSEYLSKYLFDNQTLRVDGGGGLVRLSGDKLHIDTQAIDAGVRGFFIVADNERVELTAHAREDDNAIKLPQKKSVKGEVGKMLQINLRDICPAEWRDFEPFVDSKWLTLSDDKKTLSGVPVLTEGRHGPYVVWPKVFDDKDEHRCVDLRVQTARRRLNMKIMPPKTDGIHLFHHALDAAIMAANVDWDKVMRLSSKIDTRDFMEQRKMDQQAGVAIPHFANLTVMENGDSAAPPKAEVNYCHRVEDAEQKGKLSTRKYRTEPWRLRNEKLSQRIPLPSIAKTDVKYIISADIRAAMELLWEKINALGEEEQKQETHGPTDKKCISQNHFLSLSEEHPLHPFNVRSARCWRMAGNSIGLFEPITGVPNKHDRRQNARHYFRREEGWAKVEVHENDKGKKTVHRVKNPFYWKNKKEPEFDVSPPAGARLVAYYRRGDKVKVNGRAGEWKITELRKEAILQPQCAESHAAKNGGTIKAVYHKLSKC